MSVFSIRPDEYRNAGATDLIRLEPLPGEDAPLIQRWIVDSIVEGVTDAARIHVSGETGTAKSLLLRTLFYQPLNFDCVCEALGIPLRPLKVYVVPITQFDSPNELISRRAIRDGSTCDEESRLVTALREQDGKGGQMYAVIWIPELGRTHSDAIQGALVDLISDVVLLDGGDTVLRVGHVAWAADSNYADTAGTFSLCEYDDALHRRWNCSITMNHPEEVQECEILSSLYPEAPAAEVAKIVALGSKIREKKRDGAFLSVPPPTIYGYRRFLRQRVRLSHLPVEKLLFGTVLGHCSHEDETAARDLLADTYGIKINLEGVDEQARNFSC